MKVWIYLKAKDSNYDKQWHQIELTTEDEANWYGKPVSNSACPVLQWPKFAWTIRGVK